MMESFRSSSFSDDFEKLLDDVNLACHDQIDDKFETEPKRWTSEELISSCHLLLNSSIPSVSQESLCPGKRTNDGAEEDSERKRSNGGRSDDGKKYLPLVLSQSGKDYLQKEFHGTELSEMRDSNNSSVTSSSFNSCESILEMFMEMHGTSSPLEYYSCSSINNFSGKSSPENRNREEKLNAPIENSTLISFECKSNEEIYLGTESQVNIKVTRDSHSSDTKLYHAPRAENISSIYDVGVGEAVSDFFSNYLLEPSEISVKNMEEGNCCDKLLFFHGNDFNIEQIKDENCLLSHNSCEGGIKSEGCTESSLLSAVPIATAVSAKELCETREVSPLSLQTFRNNDVFSQSKLNVKTLVHETHKEGQVVTDSVNDVSCGYINRDCVSKLVQDLNSPCCSCDISFSSSELSKVVHNNEPESKTSDLESDEIAHKNGSELDLNSILVNPTQSIISDQKMHLKDFKTESSSSFKTQQIHNTNIKLNFTPLPTLINHLLSEKSNYLHTKEMEAFPVPNLNSSNHKQFKQISDLYHASPVLVEEHCRRREELRPSISCSGFETQKNELPNLCYKQNACSHLTHEGDNFELRDLGGNFAAFSSFSVIKCNPFKLVVNLNNEGNINSSCIEKNECQRSKRVGSDSNFVVSNDFDIVEETYFSKYLKTVIGKVQFRVGNNCCIFPLFISFDGKSTEETCISNSILCLATSGTHWKLAVNYDGCLVICHTNKMDSAFDPPKNESSLQKSQSFTSRLYGFTIIPNTNSKVKTLVPFFNSEHLSRSEKDLTNANSNVTLRPKKSESFHGSQRNSAACDVEMYRNLDSFSPVNKDDNVCITDSPLLSSQSKGDNDSKFDDPTYKSCVKNLKPPFVFRSKSETKFKAFNKEKLEGTVTPQRSNSLKDSASGSSSNLSSFKGFTSPVEDCTSDVIKAAAFISSVVELSLSPEKSTSRICDFKEENVNVPSQSNDNITSVITPLLPNVSSSSLYKANTNESDNYNSSSLNKSYDLIPPVPSLKNAIAVNTIVSHLKATNGNFRSKQNSQAVFTSMPTSVVASQTETSVLSSCVSSCAADFTSNSLSTNSPSVSDSYSHSLYNTQLPISTPSISSSESNSTNLSNTAAPLNSSISSTYISQASSSSTVSSKAADPHSFQISLSRPTIFAPSAVVTTSCSFSSTISSGNSVLSSSPLKISNTPSTIISSSSRSDSLLESVEKLIPFSISSTCSVTNVTSLSTKMSVLPMTPNSEPDVPLTQSSKTFPTASEMLGATMPHSTVTSGKADVRRSSSIKSMANDIVKPRMMQNTRLNYSTKFPLDIICQGRLLEMKRRTASPGEYSTPPPEGSARQRLSSSGQVQPLSCSEGNYSTTRSMSTGRIELNRKTSFDTQPSFESIKENLSNQSVNQEPRHITSLVVSNNTKILTEPVEQKFNEVKNPPPIVTEAETKMCDSILRQTLIGVNTCSHLLQLRNSHSFNAKLVEKKHERDKNEKSENERSEKSEPSIPLHTNVSSNLKSLDNESTRQVDDINEIKIIASEIEKLTPKTTMGIVESSTSQDKVCKTDEINKSLKAKGENTMTINEERKVLEADKEATFKNDERNIIIEKEKIIETLLSRERSLNYDEIYHFAQAFVTSLFKAENLVPLLKQKHEEQMALSERKADLSRRMISNEESKELKEEKELSLILPTDGQSVTENEQLFVKLPEREGVCRSGTKLRFVPELNHEKESTHTDTLPPPSLEFFNAPTTIIQCETSTPFSVDDDASEQEERKSFEEHIDNVTSVIEINNLKVVDLNECDKIKITPEVTQYEFESVPPDLFSESNIQLSKVEYIIPLSRPDEQESKMFPDESRCQAASLDSHSEGMGASVESERSAAVREELESPRSKERGDLLEVSLPETVKPLTFVVEEVIDFIDDSSSSFSAEDNNHQHDEKRNEEPSSPLTLAPFPSHSDSIVVRHTPSPPPFVPSSSLPPTALFFPLAASLTFPFSIAASSSTAKTTTVSTTTIKIIEGNLLRNNQPSLVKEYKTEILLPKEGYRTEEVPVDITTLPIEGVLPNSSKSEDESQSSLERPATDGDALASASASSTGSAISWGSNHGPIARRDPFPLPDQDVTPPWDAFMAANRPDSDEDRAGYESDDDFESMDAEMRRLEEKLKKFERELGISSGEDLSTVDTTTIGVNKSTEGNACHLRQEDIDVLRSFSLPDVYPPVNLLITKHLSLMKNDESLFVEGESENSCNDDSKDSTSLMFVKPVKNSKPGERRSRSLDLQMLMRNITSSQFSNVDMNITPKSESVEDILEQATEFRHYDSESNVSMEQSEEKISCCAMNVEDEFRTYHVQSPEEIGAEEMGYAYSDCVTAEELQYGYIWHEHDSDIAALDFDALEDFNVPELQDSLFFIFEDDDDPEEYVVPSHPAEYKEYEFSEEQHDDSILEDKRKTDISLVSAFKNSFRKAAKYLGPNPFTKPKEEDSDEVYNIVYDNEAYNNHLFKNSFVSNTQDNRNESRTEHASGMYNVPNAKLQCNMLGDIDVGVSFSSGEYHASPAVCILTSDEENIKQDSLAEMNSDCYCERLSGEVDDFSRSPKTGLYDTSVESGNDQTEVVGVRDTGKLENIHDEPPPVPPRRSFLFSNVIESIGKDQIEIMNIPPHRDKSPNQISQGNLPLLTPEDLTESINIAGHKPTSLKQLKRKQQERIEIQKTEDALEASGCTFCVGVPVSRGQSDQAGNHNRHPSPHPRALPERRTWPPRVSPIVLPVCVSTSRLHIAWPSNHNHVPNHPFDSQLDREASVSREYGMGDSYHYTLNCTDSCSSHCHSNTYSSLYSSNSTTPVTTSDSEPLWIPKPSNPPNPTQNCINHSFDIFPSSILEPTGDRFDELGAKNETNSYDLYDGSIIPCDPLPFNATNCATFHQSLIDSDNACKTCAEGSVAEIRLNSLSLFNAPFYKDSNRGSCPLVFQPVDESPRMSVGLTHCEDQLHYSASESDLESECSN